MATQKLANWHCFGGDLAVKIMSLTKKRTIPPSYNLVLDGFSLNQGQPHLLYLLPFSLNRHNLINVLVILWRSFDITHFFIFCFAFWATGTKEGLDGEVGGGGRSQQK